MGELRPRSMLGTPYLWREAVFAAGCAHGGPEGPHFFFVGCDPFLLGRYAEIRFSTIFPFGLGV
jgi:hypothetical protein